MEGALIVQPGNHLYDHSYVASVLRKHPDKFVGCALVNPTLEAASAAAEVERLALQDGFRALRFNPYLWPDGRRMSDEVPHLFPLLSSPILSRPLFYSPLPLLSIPLLSAAVLSSSVTSSAILCIATALDSSPLLPSRRLCTTLVLRFCLNAVPCGLQCPCYAHLPMLERQL